MKKVNFSWRVARDLHSRLKVISEKKGISIGAMLNIIVHENIAKYEG